MEEIHLPDSLKDQELKLLLVSAGSAIHECEREVVIRINVFHYF